MPLPIAGAIFCANQYVRQKNIIEDYAYKMVLAKSIVGFSEQIRKDNSPDEEYTHYIKTVLNEIHNDPLRRRHSKYIKKDNSTSSMDSFKDAMESIKKLQEVFTPNK
ncbi:MAG: hypothetical protein ACXWEY_01790 [Bacteroidia bacterium]